MIHISTIIHEAEFVTNNEKYSNSQDKTTHLDFFHILNKGAD